jgi:hypothetical protein
MYVLKDKETPKDNERGFGSIFIQTETSIGESHSKRAR